MVQYLSCKCCSRTDMSSSFSAVSTDCHPIFFLSCTLHVSQKRVSTLAIAIFYSTVVTIHESTPVDPCFVHETQIVQHMNSFMHTIMKQMTVAAVAQTWSWCTDWNQNGHSFSCLVNWWQLVLDRHFPLTIFSDICMVIGLVFLEHCVLCHVLNVAQS